MAFERRRPLGGCSCEATYPEGHRHISEREPDDRASGGWEDDEQTGLRAARAVKDVAELARAVRAGALTSGRG